MAQQTPAENPGNTKAARRGSLLWSLVIGLVAFLVLLGLAEYAYRRQPLTEQVNLRSLGVYHSQFEIKWFKLQDYARRHNGVDVILVGNSMVNTGINPQVLARRYEEQTGDSLRIFNFGIEGLTVAPNADLVKVLVEEFHPGSIVFVTEMRDYTAANGLEVESQFLSDEWLSARISGSSTPRSWLKDNSAILQKLLTLRNWSRADFLDNLLMSIRRYGDTSGSGYEADRNTGENIDQPPNPADPKEQENFELFSNYSMDPGRIADLQRILANGSEKRTVFVTEMPIYPTYFVYFGGEPVHAQYLSDLQEIVANDRAVFLQPVSWELIPMEGRVDHHHLNYIGAPLYSELLADQLADSCVQNQVCLLHAEGLWSAP